MCSCRDSLPLHTPAHPHTPSTHTHTPLRVHKLILLGVVTFLRLDGIGTPRISVRRLLHLAGHH